MERQNHQFDERDALLIAGALKNRAPTPGDERNRKRYSNQVREGTAGDDVVSDTLPDEPEDGPEGEIETGKTGNRKSLYQGKRQTEKRSAFFDGKAEAGGTDQHRRRRVFRKRSTEELAEHAAGLAAKDASAKAGRDDGNPIKDGLSEEADSAAISREHFFTNEIDARRALPDEGIVRQKGRKKPVAGKETGRTDRFFGDRKASGGRGKVYFSEDRTAGSVAAVRSGLFYESSFSAEYQLMSAKDFQRMQIRRAYAGGNRDSVYIPVVSEIREHRAFFNVLIGVKKAGEKLAAVAVKHPVILAVTVILALFMAMFSTISVGCLTLVSRVLTPAFTETSYSADDADINGAETDYRVLVAELRTKLSDLESYYPGYENYELQSGEIGHDPYRLAALLTVLHECYLREDVQDTLQEIFNAQYAISTEDITGSSTTKTVRVGQSLGVVVTSGYCNCAQCCGQWAGGPTASGVYPQANHTIAVDAWNPIVPMGTKIVMNGVEYTVEDTGPLERYGVAFDVYYDDHNVAQNHGHQNWEAFIADDNGSESVTVTVVNSVPTLKATLKNYGLDHAAHELLDEDGYARYQLLVETKGNRPELFPDYNALSADAGLTYAPPGSALSDEKFRNMYNEAIKYLGIEYVWGGESPETGFDCSGFVFWVINHCGNGWDYGRLTAEEWRQTTMYVPPSDAKPGDLVFFQGTYDTEGASHIAIYLGEGMIIHAGHPVQIGSMNTPYLQEHFLAFGRIPS